MNRARSERSPVGALFILVSVASMACGTPAANDDSAEGSGTTESEGTQWSPCEWGAQSGAPCETVGEVCSYADDCCSCTWTCGADNLWGSQSCSNPGDGDGDETTGDGDGTSGDGDDTTGDGDGTSGDGDGDGDGTSGDGDGDGTLSVLFIGNSYTGVNDLPGVVESIASDAATAGGAMVLTQRITPGGTTMFDHWSNATTVATIDQGGWDYVVFQGQSLEPILDPAGFTTYGRLLGERACDTGADVLFYETWAREAGHDFYTWGYADDPAQAQALLRTQYQALADTTPCATTSAMAPVGDAWESTWTDDPAIDLYSGDGSHPTINGTYLGALVFWSTMTGGDPIGAWAPGTVDPTDATALQGHAAGALP